MHSSEHLSPGGESRGRLSADQLVRIAGIVEIADRDRIWVLERRIDSALAEHAVHLQSPPRPAAARHETFEDLLESCASLRQELRSLQPEDRRAFDEAGESKGRLCASTDDAASELQKISRTVRVAKGRLPPLWHEPTRGLPKWLLVHRLAVSFAEARRLVIGGAAALEPPRGGRGRIEQRDVGVFRDFVLQVFDAARLSHDGVDDVIREVCNALHEKTREPRRLERLRALATSRPASAAALIRSAVSWLLERLGA